MTNNQTIVRIVDATRAYTVNNDQVLALRGVNLDITRGSFTAFMGRSGSGKTTLLNMIGGLDTPSTGSIEFLGKDMATMSSDALTLIRRNQIGFIFQAFALLPILSAWENVELPLRIIGVRSGAERRQRAHEALTLVGLEQWSDHRPSEMSGGQQQRVAIARALVTRPPVLIADEPTTALDVTIQAQILELMRDLRKTVHTAIMLITHDLGVIAEMADRVVVMYAGQIVEMADVVTLFDAPLHPYSQALLDSMPVLGDQSNRTLAVIEGTVPMMINPPVGCRFADRCHKRFARCDSAPPLIAHEGRQVRCWLYAENGASL